VKPLIISATPFVPQLRGDFDHKIDGMDATVPVMLPKLHLGAKEIRSDISETSIALVLRGEISSTKK
jgi:hypothetical protein